MTWLLGRATGYFAVTNYLGDRFVTSDNGMAAFLACCAQHGVAFIDDGSMPAASPGAWARASADSIIDETQTPAGIVGRLNALEARAKATGTAWARASAIRSPSRPPPAGPPVWKRVACSWRRPVR
jgi:polysaccharide deacetylase 2 family uncharacterized protein YibQ